MNTRSLEREILPIPENATTNDEIHATNEVAVTSDPPGVNVQRNQRTDDVTLRDRPAEQTGEDAIIELTPSATASGVVVALTANRPSKTGKSGETGGTRPPPPPNRPTETGKSGETGAASPPPPPKPPPETGKSGESGALDVSNAEFVAAIFGDLPAGEHAAVCTKSGDPQVGGWPARRADKCVSQLSARNNNYVSSSTFHIAPDGTLTARKERIAAYRFISLDDLGGKIPLERLGDFRVSWRVETSPGNYQAGIILREPITNVAEAEALQGAILRGELCDPGATGLTRWARLPIGINGKPKYADASGKAFQCALREWNPDLRYTVDEIVQGLNLQIAPVRPPAGAVQNAAVGREVQNAGESVIVSRLKARGLYKKRLEDGKHDVTCPWVAEHTDQVDNGTVYFEPSEAHPGGGFCCQHSHGDKYRIKQLVAFLDGTQNRPVIRVAPGDMDGIADSAEQALARGGRFFQFGGLIASVVIDPVTGDPSIVRCNLNSLARELSVAARWESFSVQKQDWRPCDPPTRYVSTVYDAQRYRHLQPLAGIAWVGSSRRTQTGSSGNTRFRKQRRMGARHGASFSPSPMSTQSGTLLTSDEWLDLLTA